MRQFETLDKLIEKHKLDALADASSFYLTWLRGRQQFLAAEKTKAEADFHAAGKTLTTALAHPQAQARPDRCRPGPLLPRLVAVSAERFADRGPRRFTRRPRRCKSSLADLAVQAAWMQGTCLVQLAAKDKKLVTPAIAALQTLKQDFPTSEQAGRAELLDHAPAAEPRVARRGDSRAGGESSRAIRTTLRRSTRSASFSTSFGPSRRPIRRRPLRWPRRLLKTVDRLLGRRDQEGDWRAPAEGDAARRRCALADGAARSGRESRRCFARSPSAAENVDAANPAAVEYQYRRLQLAQKAGDRNGATPPPSGSPTNGSGSPYELPALVIVARAADAAVEAAPAPPSGRPAARSGPTFTPGWSSCSAIRRPCSPPAKTRSLQPRSWPSMMKTRDTGRRPPIGCRSWSRRCRATGGCCGGPGWRRSRRAATPQALEHWRTLLAGLASGSDEWLEAKYYQLACLLKTDRPAADKVWQQFKLLFPEVKSAAWQDKFAELEKNFVSLWSAATRRRLRTLAMSRRQILKRDQSPALQIQSF